MKKDRIRDYATDAFRLYASLGKPKYDELKKHIYNKALFCDNAEPSKAIVRANTEVENNTPLLLDVMAVEKTIDILIQGKKEHIVKAVERVYFVSPYKPLHKNEVIERVRYLAQELPASERAIFYWLKEARLLFAAIRGLRINDDIIKSLQ